jgi:integrase
MSGLTSEQLDELEEYVAELLGDPWDKELGRPRELTLREALIVACGYTRNNITEEIWGEIFDVNQSTISRYITFLTPLIDQATDEFRPTAEEAADATRDAVALENSPDRLRADALLLLRATGMRIGELTMLELDCVHEVPGQGAWLKVPLGKLLTERMVPIDDETIQIIDRITEHRSPGRPLRHPRTGKPADFLLTHQGRRISAETIRDELHRAAAQTGLNGVVPHMLRHTYVICTPLWA